jgi:hypothetical protein
VKDREPLDDELEALALELRRLPTPRPPAAVVSRVRTLAHQELAGQADEKLNGLVLGFLLVFSWTVSLFALFAVRLLNAEGFLQGLTGSRLSWSVAYYVSAWISGLAVLVLVAFHVRKERSLA